MEDYDEDELAFAANDIVSQIKNASKSLKREAKSAEEIKLDKDDVDDFIRNKAAQVINDAAEIISDRKDELAGGGSPNDFIAFAEVLKAFTSAVEILNKRQISDSKNKNQKELKEMEIDSRLKITEKEEDTKLHISQNAILKLMFEQQAEKDKAEAEKLKEIKGNAIDV